MKRSSRARTAGLACGLVVFVVMSLALLVSDERGERATPLLTRTDSPGVATWNGATWDHAAWAK